MTKSINAPEPRRRLVLEKSKSPVSASTGASTVTAAPSAERSLADIASAIKADWREMKYSAQPYLDAMATMGSIDNNHGLDSGTSVVCYFLSNATSWRGPIARRVKDELTQMLKARGIKV